MNLFEMFEPKKKLTLLDALRDFLPMAMAHLKINVLPRITFQKDVESAEHPTFGRFTNESKVVFVDIENRHPNDILRTLAHELTHFAQNERGELDSTSGETGSTAENEANATAGVIMRNFNQAHPEYLTLELVVLPAKTNEEWSEKYKRSIDCSNPKGFSQKAHCAGRKKTDENFADGKNPGRKGLAKRSGVNCKQSVSKLRSIAKNSSGEKQRMAHWCANMKAGRNK